MTTSYGLYSHIRANRIRSAILLLGFLALLQALSFSFLIVWFALVDGTSLSSIFRQAATAYTRTWPIGMALAGIWFAVAWFAHQKLIDFATGAKPVTRKEQPKLYNALENLCISRGIPMPALKIIESSSLNAFASGLRPGQYAVSVTRGLTEALSEEEIEAVLAHELAHIKNRDTQLLVVALVFAGIFSFFGQMVAHSLDVPWGWSSRRNDDRSSADSASDSSSSGGGFRLSGKSKDNGAVIIAIVIAIAIIMLTWGVSVLIRFALSRSREYLADAGAVELTKNPDALISALRKIERNASLDVSDQMAAFFIEAPLAGDKTSWLATHPSIDSRVAALVTMAGGRDVSPAAAEAKVEKSAAAPSPAARPAREGSAAPAFIAGREPKTLQQRLARALDRPAAGPRSAGAR